MRMHYAVKRDVNTTLPAFDHPTRFVRALVTINTGGDAQEDKKDEGTGQDQRGKWPRQSGARAIFGRGRLRAERRPFLLDARPPMFRHFSSRFYGERSRFRKRRVGGVRWIRDAARRRGGPLPRVVDSCFSVLFMTLDRAV